MDQGEIDQTGVAQRASRRFRWLAILVLVGAAVSAFLFAMLDAATTLDRIGGDPPAARPTWLHTFSISVLTCGVATYALSVDRWASTRAARSVYAVAAAANLTVPIFANTLEGLRLVISLAHGGLAILLVGMVVTTRSNRRGETNLASDAAVSG